MHATNASLPAAVTPMIDVLLLLEGTYPYVRGGVSTWVQQLIGDMPDVRFGIVFLGGVRSQYGEPQYPIPPNVVHIESHYLMDPEPPQAPVACPGSSEFIGNVEELLSWFRQPEQAPPEAALDCTLSKLGEEGGMTTLDFLYSKASWGCLRENFQKNCPDSAFVSYFWTIRSMHLPLMKLAAVARQVPQARLCHSISTGYAGCLGAMLNRRQGTPLLLTEHGIYTKERRIDLQALFAAEMDPNYTGSVDTTLRYEQRLWLRFFAGLGRITYHAADRIVALYGQNQKRQVQDGATPGRTEVIPNGVDVSRYLGARNARDGQTEIPRVVGLIGRIVPIKDIKTFIRTIRILSSRVPGTEGWLIGPTEEDEDYVEECRAVIKSLGVQDQIKFMGFQKPEEILPRLGIVMLTSISEAFPLVILEAFASCVPVVATDVGACRELIEGRGADDQALGKAGRVVPIADPNSAAAAAVELLTDKQAWQAASRAGCARAERFYDRQAVFARYRTIYATYGVD